MDLLTSLLAHPPYRMVVVSIVSLVTYLAILFTVRFIYPRKKIPYVLILLGFSILPIISVLREGTYESGDLNIHIARTMSFFQALKDGVLIPRWAGELNATYGYPLFNYYYPLPYYLSSLFHFIGFNFVNSVKVLLVATYISSGLIMFYWLKNHVSEKSAFLGSLFYLYAPYHLIDLHFRATVGEMTAFVFLPLSIYLMDKVIKHKSFLWQFTLGASCALLILSHPAISLLGYGLFVVYIASHFKQLKLVGLVKVYIPLFLGVLLSAFYWVPVFAEANLVHQQIGKIMLDFPGLSNMLYSNWRYGLLFQGPYGELSHVMGYAHWLVVFLTIVLFVSKKIRHRSHMLFVILFILFFFLTQKISSPIWNNVLILKKILIVSRIQVILTLITSSLAAFLVERLNKSRLYYLLIAVVIGTTLLNWGNRRNVPEIKDPQIKANLPHITSQGEGAWNAVTVARPFNDLWQKEVPENHIESIDGSLIILSEQRETNRHYYKINLKQGRTIKENTYYFPGWTLLINGNENNIVYDNPKYPGIVTFDLEKGVHRVLLIFRDTSTRKYSQYISIFTLLSSGAYLIFLGISKSKRVTINKKTIPIAKPSLGKEEIDAVHELLTSGFIVKGKKTEQVEQILCKKFNKKYCVLLTSGTASLNTALTVLGIGKGDEVITTPFTFIATANAINYVGARVVFADIDPQTFNINPKEIENKITKRTKAIIAVDLYGHPFDYLNINKIAKKNRLYLIEDAAQAHGAYYKNKPAGSLGEISILSFYGTKIVTSGEGGALLTNNKRVYQKAVEYRAHGVNKNKPYLHTSVGYNFLPTDIQAAVLAEQLKKLDKFVGLRRKAAKYYSGKLKDIDGIILPKIEDENEHAFLCYTIRINPKLANRDKVVSKLNKAGVGARVYYPLPLHLQPLWKKLGYKFKKGDFPEAEKASKEVLSLPMFSNITKEEIDFTTNTLKTILER